MDIKTVGCRLVALRADRTVDEVAGTLGISSFSLMQYELGARIPRDEVKLRLSVYYGVSLEALFFLE